MAIIWWQPTPIEQQYIKLVASMCVDCLMGNGVKDRHVFTSNLRMMADEIGTIPGDCVVDSDKLVDSREKGAE